MQSHNVPTILKSALCATVLLLLGAAMAFGQTATVTGGPLDFGSVAIGATSASQTATLTITNTGAAALDPIGIGNLSFSSSVFSEAAGDTPTNTCASGVAPSSSCAITLNVVFQPAAIGTIGGSLTVSATTTDNSVTPPVTTPVPVTGSVPLSGSGYRPTVSPASLLFADPGAGGTSAPQTLTVTNTSVTALTFSLNFDNSAYAVVSGGTCPTSPFVLNNASTPANSCTVNLVFIAPTGADTTVETGSLTVTATDPTSTNIAVSHSPVALTETDAAGTVGGAPTDVDLTAGSSTITLPDGSTVPMWGYRCALTMAPSTCRSLNPNSSGWSPVVITIPSGTDLAIELTNNLSFLHGNSVPTSLVIVGQLGGGLGNTATTVSSPAHGTQVATWPIAGDLTGATNVPPPQGPRVQSFSTEVAAGTTQRLVWTNPRPGTYLLESGTHPSIQGAMGLYGILVVTAAPTAPGGVPAPGCAYPGASVGTCATPYDAEVPLLFSEIDPVQNTTVNAAVNTAGFSETAVWSGQPGGCGNPSSGAAYLTCYPPAVNYKPLYYMINGVAFNKTNAVGSLFPVTPATITPASGAGSVLVRMVNAGLRMHVPSIVGSQVAGTSGGTSPIVTGFKMIAEDGNPLPGTPRVQSEVFMAAGKTYDVMINGQQTSGTTFTQYPNALAVFDRELSLSANSVARDGGMLAYIGINGAGLPAAASAGTGVFAAAVANPDTYNSVISGKTLTVSDPGKGVLANDINVYGVKVVGTAPAGLTLNPDGTFTYSGGPTSFTYCGNGANSGPACATVSLGAATLEAGTRITCNGSAYTSTLATTLSIKPPGILAGCTDAAGYPLTVNGATLATPLSAVLTGPGTGTAVVDPNGGFNASVSAAGSYSFTFQAQNSQNTVSAASATVTLTFPTANGPTVTVLDGVDKTTVISDYRWIIEEDRTFYVDPKCIGNPLPSGCPTVNSQGSPAVFGTNFHTSNMPVVAAGCTGSNSCESGQTLLGANAVCDVGNGVCRTDATQQTAVLPSQVHLDPTKRYYLSILPGDAAQPFIAGYAGAPDCSTAGVAAGSCGHGMGGAPIAAGQTAVTVLTQPSPYPPAKLTVFVFEDDYPLNGEHDAGGGVDVLSPQEPGLGGFQITLFDDAGGTGDATGQPTYDMFNMPLTNSLAGTIDPVTNQDACPISPQVTANTTTGDGTQKGIVGMIVTCPKYESDGVTLSPLAGQAIVNNLYQGRYGVVATPNADRIARGEEWLQTNTLDGQKAHDSFMRIGEPAYFQEFGPAGYHVSIGFANPKVINSRLAPLCQGTTCPNELKGHVTTARMSRPPDERLYGSGSRDSFAFTQCYASLGDPDGADFAFVKCDDQGNFDFTGLPTGNFKLTIFDQWNDQIVDGISTPIGLTGNLDMGEVAVHQWQANIYTRTFFDTNGNGVSDKDSQGNDTETGLPLVATNIRFRDGSFSNFNNTDLNGYAGFNEVFPLFNWYTIETDSTRFKTTGVHVVYDAGGPTDGTTGGGGSTIGQFYANTVETNSLPANLRVPGAVYCDAVAKADCQGLSIATGPVAGGSSGPTSGTLSTGRIDPPFWFGSYGWQGFSGQNSFLEFGKKPFVAGETGGIHGHVVYASTRPFDDPQLLLQLSWEPLVPHVTVNLYKEGVASDGVTQTLTLVDQTQTSSFDDWAQGFRADGVPNMNCPGQGTADPFYFGMQNQPNYLDWYNSQHGGPPVTPLPNNSQFKCYDGMHNWNQLQPAPYDGMYAFPSVTGLNPTSGKPAGSNCHMQTTAEPWGCIPNPDSTDPYRAGAPMLPAGKYVVEVVVPPGFELVKEEDKNILIGDNYIAPVTQQFGPLGSIFIMPDQSEVSASSACTLTSTYGCNPQNSTQNLGRAEGLPSHEGDTGSVESFWPCVGAARVVPDYISLFPGSAEVAPFAGATRNLCDRKEVTLDDQTAALAKFYIFTSTHVASHFTGVITDDFTAEFDPFSPQFGEKFAPAYLPVSIKDWAGNEINRVYADMFGAYNGLNYSTWEVNPPNPTGYGPTMMVTCMNDRGPNVTPDPLYQTGYSQFCYELPFMPGQTGYFDTPVVPTSSFSEGYNHPDCNYPDATPAISEVDGDGEGPWVGGSGHKLTIKALGDQMVDNYGYSGPQVNTNTYSWATQKVKRHYGFGSCQTVATSGTGPCSVALVGNDGVAHSLTGVGWSDTTITGAVPTGVPNCAVQQQAQYVPAGTTSTQCGQLVITAANGKQSIDTVTVTIGGKAPTHVGASSTIQSAIDLAQPGDMIIIDPICTRGNSGNPVACSSPGNANETPVSHNEMLIMWKPVRLQGVGAVSTIIDASTQPAGKLLDPWRQRINCLFGLTPDGRPRDPADNSCAAGWKDASGGPNFPSMIVDRLPFEAVLGWDTTINGNLAEQLIEPSLMGAYEGATITVLGKGVNLQQGDPDPFGAAVGSAYTAGTTLLLAGDCGANTTTATNLYPGNFYCNPSSIDGLSIQNSSQGGGGIFVHAFAHNIQIANNRVSNNTGTLSGGITVGQGEHADVALAGAALLTFPGPCETSGPNNLALPFCYDMNVNVHNNAVTLNSSMGDELFSSTPAGAGGVNFCTGADYYKFNYNWVCGNLSTGDGGGVAHIGFIKNGHIEHNSILFNQSTNPTITTNGGGLLIMGAPDVDPACSTNDQDCVSPPGSITPSDGTGPGLTINANLIMGNAADSGSGGGLRLQHINGNDVVNNPTNPNRWNDVTVTNNIIVNNVAGWDGGGVSLQDALETNIINNTIVSNDSTASAGPLFGSLFAPLASTPGVNCTTSAGTQSCPQVAGLVSVLNSPVLVANLPATITCPAGNFDPSGSASNGSCRTVSYPYLANSILWQNRSFVVGVGSFGSGSQSQQKLVALYNSAFSTGTTVTPATVQAASQTSTGVCPTGSSYWDIGVRGDFGPSNHSGGAKLLPRQSLITDVADYSTNGNTGANPVLMSQYCNGSRVPPELGSMGYTVNPGTNETNALPTPVFSLTPSATVDEGNNWINLRWGPLALANPVSLVTLGNYVPAQNSPAIDTIPTTAATYANAPSTDFFGKPRPDIANTPIDIGAVEFQRPATPAANLAPNPLTFANTLVGTNSAAQTVTLTNVGGATLNFSAATLTGPFNLGGGGTCVPTGAINSLAPGASCTYRVRFAPTVVGGPQSGTLSVASNDPASPAVMTMSGTGIGLSSIAPNTGVRGTAVQVTITGLGLTGATAVAVAGGGVTPSAFTAVNNTTITATFTISSGAAATARNVTVTMAGGATSNAVTFTVQGPTLTSINPTSGARGTTVPVQLTGTNLSGATAVTVSGTGVTCTGITSTATTVNANCAITAGATLSSRTVTVTTPIGTTNTVQFAVVNPPTATLTSISPTTGVRGTTINTVTFIGTNLTNGTTVQAGTNITVSGITVNATYTQLTATFTIASGAVLGARNITVTNPNGTASNAVSFTVTGATVAFSGPTPSLVNGSGTTHTGLVTVSNTATGPNAGPFTFTAAPTVPKTGGPGVFSIAGGTCTSTTVLNSGGSCTINVQYAPGGSTAPAMANVTVTGTGLATATAVDAILAN